MKTIVLKNVKLFVVPNALEVDDLGQLKVQLWGHIDASENNAASGNLDDHGVLIIEGENSFFARPRLSAIPVSVFAGKQEGDTVTFMTEGWEESKGERKECVFIFEDALLQQKGWRYERFGAFHEVLNRLVQNAKANKMSA